MMLPDLQKELEDVARIQAQPVQPEVGRAHERLDQEIFFANVLDMDRHGYQRGLPFLRDFELPRRPYHLEVNSRGKHAYEHVEGREKNREEDDQVKL